jgi:hypothetical protein
MWHTSEIIVLDNELLCTKAMTQDSRTPGFSRDSAMVNASSVSDATNAPKSHQPGGVRGAKTRENTTFSAGWVFR